MAPRSICGATGSTSPAASSPTPPQNTAGSIAGNTAAASGTLVTTDPAVTALATTQTTSTAAAGTTGGVTGATTARAAAPATGTTSNAIPAASTNTGTTVTTTAAGATASLSDPAESAGLQVKIGSALKSEPTLSTSNVLVNVSGDTIELSGSVPSGKEKITARRIAQSFAGNRKVVDRITVTGRGNGATPPDSPKK